MKKGKLIVLEGSCGTGKSTLAHNLLAFFESQGVKAIYNHGSLSLTKVGRDYKIVTQSYPELFLTSYYVADLVQLTLRFIKPWLNDGYVVIQDRYSDSIISYVKVLAQMNGVEVDIKKVIDLYTELGLLEFPDCVVWCRASKDVILKRLNSNDVAHYKYLENPKLIQFVQNEFACLYENQIGNKKVIVFETDKESDIRSIIRRFL
jgi:thymidylate kinase